MYQHDSHHTGYSSSKGIDTNEILWRFQANGVIGGISVYDHKTIFGTDTSDEHQLFLSAIYCLDDQGSMLWNYEAAGDFNTPPTIINDKVYIGNTEGSVFCFQSTTGELLWSQSQSNDAVASPLVIENKVVYESLDGNVYCLHSETGELLWKTPISNDVLSHHTFSDGKIYVGNHCLNLYTGSIIWTSPIGLQFLSSISYQNDKLYVGSQDEKFYCLDAQTGEKVWKSYSGSMTWITGPALAYGNVYVGNRFGFIYCLDAVTGEYQWSTKMSARAVSSPVICDGSIYIGSEDNSLYCLNAYTGEKQWEYTHEYPFLSSMAIAENKLYSASGKTLFCFGAPCPNGDLACTGSLQFTDKTPGTTVQGQFLVYNIGPEGSLLNWNVKSNPRWGNWTFTPASGSNLSPKDAPTIVEVTLIVPQKEQDELTGEITIINTDDSMDSEIIEVSLSTPKQQFPIYWIMSFIEEHLGSRHCSMPLLRIFFSPIG